MIKLLNKHLIKFKIKSSIVINVLKMISLLKESIKKIKYIEIIKIKYNK